MMDAERVKEGIERVAEQLQPDGRPEPETGVDIEALPAADIAEAATVIAEAFRPENFTTAAFGTDAEADAAFRALIRAELRVAKAHNQPLFVARDSETDEILGVVILFRPGFEPTTLLLGRNLLWRPRDSLRLIRGIQPKAARRVLAAHEAPRDVRATNYTLEYIAVDPDRQGEGIGGQLLDAVHAFTDRDPGASGVYLATAGEDTRDIYAADGYETIEVRVDKRLHPTLRAWHMRRPRRP